MECFTALFSTGHLMGIITGNLRLKEYNVIIHHVRKYQIIWVLGKYEQTQIMYFVSLLKG